MPAGGRAGERAGEPPGGRTANVQASRRTAYQTRGVDQNLPTWAGGRPHLPGPRVADRELWTKKRPTASATGATPTMKARKRAGWAARRPDRKRPSLAAHRLPDTRRGPKPAHLGRWPPTPPRTTCRRPRTVDKKRPTPAPPAPPPPAPHRQPTGATPTGSPRDSGPPRPLRRSGGQGWAGRRPDRKRPSLAAHRLPDTRRGPKPAHLGRWPPTPAPTTCRRPRTVDKKRPTPAPPARHRQRHRCHPHRVSQTQRAAPTTPRPATGATDAAPRTSQSRPGWAQPPMVASGVRLSCSGRGCWTPPGGPGRP